MESDHGVFTFLIIGSVFFGLPIYVLWYINHRYQKEKEKARDREDGIITESIPYYGSDESIPYYDSDRKMVKSESFYTEEYTRNDGIAKSILYHDSNGKMVKSESFYAEEYSRNDGIAKSILYYGSNGKMVKMEFYGNDGSLIKTNLL